ncbi:hypothetical protein D3C81_1271590 [compost metagenome]
MIDPSRITNVLATQLTFRVHRRRKQLGHGDFLRIFLRFGQVNRDFHIPERGRLFPIDVLANPVHPDVIAVHGQLIERVCCRDDSLLGFRSAEGRDRFRRARHQQAHNLSIQQIAVSSGIFWYQADRDPVINQNFERLLRTG